RACAHRRRARIDRARRNPASHHGAAVRGAARRARRARPRAAGGVPYRPPRCRVARGSRKARRRHQPGRRRGYGAQHRANDARFARGFRLHETVARIPQKQLIAHHAHRCCSHADVALTSLPHMASNQNQTSIRAVFGALFLALWLAALDQTVVSTALPTMVGDLGGLSYLSWVVTAYLLTSTVAGPLYGKFGDLYGRKIVLQVAIGVFLVGSALCGIAQNMVQLIVFRALEGVGGGGLIVITIAVIGDLIPPRERGRYQGFFGAVFGVATIVGPLVGGFFVDHLGWRWIFYITLPTGILALAVIAAVLPSRSTRRQHAIDHVGALLLTAALSAVILFTGLGGTTFPWTSPVMVGLM